MEPWYRLAVGIVQPIVWVLFRRDFRRQDRIPSSGGCIVAVNHTSYADFVVTAVFVHESGRRPRFLGKASIFRVPITGRIIRGARQIPVYRDSADAAQALTAAVERIAGAVEGLAPHFPHQADHLAAVIADLHAWPQGGFARPDFMRSLELFRPEQAREDGIEHLVVFRDPFCVYIGNTTRCSMPSSRACSGRNSSSERMKSGRANPP